MKLDHWVWLGMAVVIHWNLPPRHRMSFVALASVGYLGWVQPALTAAYLLAVCLAHAVVLQLDRSRGGTLRWTVVTGLAVMLAAWKFLPTAVGGLSFREASEFGLAPLGLSYLVFKLVHVCVEVGRRTLPVPGFAEFVGYLFFVPMFTAGPIERLDHFRAGREPAWSRELWVEGGTRIVHGLIKKVLLSESLIYASTRGSLVGDAGVEAGQISPAAIWVHAALSYLHIYLDFSGYSDMAVGTARLLGFRLAENFHWPVLASNPSDFWRRWHVSLSQWCQHYVYMPGLGVVRSPYLPLFLVFVVMGAWHIFSWNRVAWAAYNTAGVIVFMGWSRRMGRMAPGSWRASGWWRWASILMTQVFVLGSVVFFMNGEDQTVGRSLALLARMLGLDSFRGGQP